MSESEYFQSNMEQFSGNGLITPTQFREQLNQCVSILDSIDCDLDNQETNMAELEAVKNLPLEVFLNKYESIEDVGNNLPVFNMDKCSNSLELGNALVQSLCSRFKNIMTKE